MPPSPQPPREPLDTDHQLPPAPRKKVGPVVGIIIILLLLILGALYFWGAALNKRANEQVPYIPSGTTTIEITQ